MRDIFLGKPLHWLLLIIIAAGLGIAGRMHVHIVYFNAFVIALIVVTVACLLIVILRSDPDDRLTREPIEDD